MSILKTLYTPWGEALDKEHPLPEYPRPQLVRESYLNLNGVWDYTVESGDERKSGRIVVPFSPESLLSGCDFQLQKDEVLVYERTFTLPEGFRKDRVLLHFGAVDQVCTVFVNGQDVGGHEGGYLPFTLDITDALAEGENRLTVRVTDRTEDSPFAYGKQRYERGGIWYTAQSGIWQTVWMESVPANYIRSVRFDVDFDNRRVAWKIDADNPDCANVVVRMNGTVIAEDWAKEDGSGFSLIMDESFRPWSPEDPFLYDVEIALGENRVRSYFGMRKFSTVLWRGFRVMALNNEPYFQTGLLDQGYWSDGLYTAPSDEAMIYDIQTMKDMGFNMLRKHIKVEPLRWYYHCDRLGMIVWQDAPSGGDHTPHIYALPSFYGQSRVGDAPSALNGRANRKGCDQHEKDLAAMMELLHNCVSLGLWVPFNEGWGQFEAKRICEKVKAADPDRLVDHASGWHDQGVGDLRSYHIYHHPLKTMRNDRRRALALTEFGGYGLPVEGHHTTDRSWGYLDYADGKALMAALKKLYLGEVLPEIRRKGLSAAVYTQVSDVEDEVNGFLTYDRRVCKADIAKMRAYNRALRFPRKK